MYGTDYRHRIIIGLFTTMRKLGIGCHRFAFPMEAVLPSETFPAFNRRIGCKGGRGSAYESLDGDQCAGLSIRYPALKALYRMPRRSSSRLRQVKDFEEIL